MLEVSRVQTTPIARCKRAVWTGSSCDHCNYRRKMEETSRSRAGIASGNEYPSLASKNSRSCCAVTVNRAYGHRACSTHWKAQTHTLIQPRHHDLESSLTLRPNRLVRLSRSPPFPSLALLHVPFYISLSAAMSTFLQLRLWPHPLAALHILPPPRMQEAFQHAAFQCAGNGC